MAEVKSEVFNMDCMDGMKGYPDKYFDLAIVDPPFFKGVGKNGFYGGAKGNHKTQYKDIEAWDDNIPNGNYYNELCRVSKNQIIWGINYFNDFKNVPVGRLVWDKHNDETTFSNCEIASNSLIKSVKIYRHRWSGFLQGIGQPKEEKFHPTQKPLGLYRWTIMNYAKLGDKILDTHLGSGSSRIAAHELGYDFTAFELDKQYFEAQQKRFEQHISQLTLFK
jgi:site-specific DNA-methyltransferase (adenine-specific)